MVRNEENDSRKENSKKKRRKKKTHQGDSGYQAMGQVAERFSTKWNALGLQFDQWFETEGTGQHKRKSKI